MKEKNDLKIIEDYIRKNLSWKEMYFKHFSVKQKLLFFMPLILFLAPVWGTLTLLHKNLWWAFIIGGFGMLLGIYLFFNQKKSFELKVFSKLYETDTCVTDLDYKVEKFKQFMSENNLWNKRYEISRSVKSDASLTSIPIIIAAFLPIFMNNYKFDKVMYYSVYMSLLFIFIAVIFVLPAFIATGSKGMAQMILTEIEKRDLDEKE